MASTIKVDNVQNQPGTNVVNKCGTTVNIGAASDNIRSAGNNLQASDGGNLISQCGTTITLGASGDTITLASGASQTGFGRSGSVNWQTGSIKTGTFTAVDGEGYFVDTSSGTATVNLPAGSAGAIVSISDYKRTFNSNNCTINPNGTEKIGFPGAGGGDLILTVNGQSVTLVYTDATSGWVNTQNAQDTQTGEEPVYNLRYMVLAGGGGSDNDYQGAGGGGGGMREISGKCFEVSRCTSYPITVGAGGNGVPGTPGEPRKGSSSIFSSITSTGGGTIGYTGACAPSCNGFADGGSGGGAKKAPDGNTAFGAGNTPPFAAPLGGPQGFPGGQGATSGFPYNSGGGGGAGAVGSNASGPTGAPGGAGRNTTILGSIPQVPSYGEPGPSPGRYFGGGGAGTASGPTGSGTACGGVGGGGNATNGASPTQVIGCAGATNMGGGGGGARDYGPGGSPVGAVGGSGIVIIRHVTACASPTASGGDLIQTCGSDTIRVFTGPGAFVA